VGCMLGYLDLRMAELNWREEYPNLAKLYKELMKRPSFSDSTPPLS
jgi:glutathione S-transferase